MTYEVRRSGRVLYHTESEKSPYSPEIEAQMVKSGHEIYVDGKKLKKGGRTTR